MKTLDTLRWVPRWVSHLGCIKGCLNYLGHEVSDGWLFGATGHAFLLNIAPGVCPSGPTAWNTAKLHDLGRNVGYIVDGVFGTKTQGALEMLQRHAWQHARKALDQGRPCYGWELDVPEFYVVYGYDETGYYYAGPGCDEGAGPKPWDTLGDTGIGVVELYSLHAAHPAEDAHTLREALSFALAFAEPDNPWTEADHATGLAGYDVWIQALREGTGSPIGVSYNAAVWTECRFFAAAFLKEAQLRLEGPIAPLLEEAHRQYQAVLKQLDHVKTLYPFEMSEALLPVDDRSQEATAALLAAKAAEEAGLDALARIVALLDR
ncbi:MAG: hypothetical protein JXB35_00375 [Anaerolineae bacterium]|nr:hypothetical protein [Anaerolineae bacterium]